MARKFRWSVEFIQKELKEWVQVHRIVNRFYEEPILSFKGFLNNEDIKPGFVGLSFEDYGKWNETNFILRMLENETDEGEELSLMAGLCFFWEICMAQVAFNPVKCRPKSSFKTHGIYLAKLIAIGALKEAEIAANIMFNGLQTRFFTSKSEVRLAPFMLSIFYQWKNSEEKSFSLNDYPDLSPIGDVYENALDLWDSTDTNKVKMMLHKMCEFHVDQSGWETNTKYFEFKKDEYMIYPVEILAIMRLRESLGLENPKIDHPIMNTPLGKLPPIRKFEPDPLLQQVIEKLKIDYPQLAKIEKGKLC